MPRELTLHTYSGGLRLVQQPVSTLNELRQNVTQIGELNITGTRPLSEFHPKRNTYEMDGTFQIVDPTARFGIRLAVNGDQGISIGYDGRSSNLFIDRMHAENASFSSKFPKYVTAPIQPQNGIIRLHIFVDQSSVEVFANDGEVTMSALMFPNSGSTGLELFSEGGSAILKDMQAWPLTSIWCIQ